MIIFWGVDFLIYNLDFGFKMTLGGSACGLPGDGCYQRRQHGALPSFFMLKYPEMDYSHRICRTPF